MDPDFENKDFTDKDMGTADIGDEQQPSAAQINTGTVTGDDNSTDTVQPSFTGESPVQEAPADSPVPGMENTAKSVSDDEYPRNIFAERDFSPAGKDPVYGGGVVPSAAGYQTPYGQPAQTPPPYAAYGAQPPYMQGATPPPPYGYGQPSPVPPYYGQNPFYAQPPYQQPGNMPGRQPMMGATPYPGYAGSQPQPTAQSAAAPAADTREGEADVKTAPAGEQPAQGVQNTQTVPPRMNNGSIPGTMPPPMAGYQPYPRYQSYQPAAPAVLPGVPDREDVKKKRPNTVLMMIILFVIIAIVVAVMVLLAINDKGKSPDEVGSSQAPVSVNIEVEHRAAEDKSDYEDESSGLFTPEGAVKYVMPSIVTVYGYKGTTIVNSNSATGVIISDDGYIITNAHVVNDLERVIVELNDEENSRLEADIIGFDANTDLAVLKVDKTDLTPAVLGSTEDLSQGQTVISIGNSGGFRNTVTKGVVSYIDREIESYSGYMIKCIQTDAPLNEGVSGGALIDLYGRVVGITTSKYAVDSSESLGFAISIDFAVPVIEDLIKEGYVTGRPRVGIMYNFIDTAYAEEHELRTGLLVREISEDCDISKTDLRVDDIITEIDGMPMNSENAIRDLQAVHKPGDRVKAKVFRKGTFEEEKDMEFEIEFTFAEFGK